MISPNGCPESFRLTFCELYYTYVYYIAQFCEIYYIPVYHIAQFCKIYYMSVYHIPQFCEIYYLSVKYTSQINVYEIHYKLVQYITTLSKVLSLNSYFFLDVYQSPEYCKPGYKAWLLWGVWASLQRFFSTRSFSKRVFNFSRRLCGRFLVLIKLVRNDFLICSSEIWSLGKSPIASTILSRDSCMLSMDSTIFSTSSSILSVGHCFRYRYTQLENTMAAALPNRKTIVYKDLSGTLTSVSVGDL